MTNNAFRSLSLPVLLCAGLLSSCSNTIPCGNGHPYLDNRERAPLQAPAGVSVPAPDPAYVVPQATAGAVHEAASTCLVKPPDVLGPLGAPAAASALNPTITRHRHGKTVNETKGPPATVAVPPPATHTPAPAASTHSSPAVATGGPLE